MFAWLKNLSFKHKVHDREEQRGMVTITCKKCGKKITLPERVQHWPDYCQECMAKYRLDEPITRKCRHCGKMFTFPANVRRWPKYCPECQENLKKRGGDPKAEGQHRMPQEAPAASSAVAASESAGGSKDAKAWKTLDTKTLLDTRHVSVYENRVQLPDGAVIEDFYTVRVPDAAMIAALTKDGKLLLKKEYRYSCGEEVTECPAGEVETDEKDPMDAAKRELLEETGYTSDRWTYLGPTIDNPSKLTNRMYLFLAEDCVKVAEQRLDENEHLSVMEVPLPTAVDMVMDGRINANTAAHLILKTERILQNRKRILQNRKRILQNRKRI